MPDTSLTSYETWLGREVQDRNGDKIGKVADIYYDDVSRRPEWVAVKTGPSRAVAPIAGSSIVRTDDDEEHLRLAYDKDQVKNAPNIVDDDEEHLSEEKERELYAHFQFDWDREGDTFGPQLTTTRADAGYEANWHDDWSTLNQPRRRLRRYGHIGTIGSEDRTNA